MEKLHAIWVFMICSCQSPKILESGALPDIHGNNFKKLAVIAIIPENAGIDKSSMENHLALDLASIGFPAISFHQNFQLSDFPADIRYDSARARLLRAGVDGILTIRLLDKEKDTVLVRDQFKITQNKMSFWYYYQSAREALDQDKGHYETISSYYWQSDLYDLKELSLVYHARSAFFQESNRTSMAHRYGKSLTKDIRKKLLLSD